jgi:hypothetical protein
MTRRERLLAAIAIAVGVVTPAAAQDVIADPVFISGPVEWSPRVDLREFGYDDNVFLEDDAAAHADITGTLTPSIGAQIVTPRWEVRTVAAADLVYFERYVDQRAFNQRYAGRAAFTVSLFQPFVAGEWQDARDRRSPEVDIRARRRAMTTTAGIGLFSLSRASLTLGVSTGSSEYEVGQVFGGADLARELNRTTEAATVGFTFALTPLTAISASGGVLRERYHLVEGKDQESQQVTVGLAFAPDAVIRGHASVGYSRLTVEDPAAIPFAGFTSDVDVVFAFVDTTRVTARYSRATAASINEPYYLQTSFGGEVQQTFLGPTDLVVRASRQKLDYPGIPSRNLPRHLDYVNSMAAGVIVRLSSTSSIDVTYELANREADDPDQQFERRRIITSVSLGF